MFDFLKTKFGKFIDNSAANVAISIAILALPLLSAAGAAIDYSILEYKRNQLQIAADLAVLESAKELGLINSDENVVKNQTKNYFFSDLDGSITTKNTDLNVEIDKSQKEVKLSASYVWQPFILHYLNSQALPIRVSSAASLAGTGKVCVIALDQTVRHSINITKRANLQADDCGVYSNSNDVRSIRVANDGVLSANLICSSGGVRGAKRSSFSPEPIVDCPRITDPLASRKPPAVGICDYKRVRLTDGEHELSPGTYCNGLRVSGTAKVKLLPGVYVIKGGRLEVTDNASFEGENVGFYLAGTSTKLIFKKQTTIALTAPEDGPMAGILFFENRNASQIEKHKITSDNARLLLGTIYLPNGTLLVDAEAPISDKSAYTAIVVRSLELDEGPTLFLNSDYAATDIPVPNGLGGGAAYLTD